MTTGKSKVGTIARKLVTVAYVGFIEQVFPFAIGATSIDTCFAFLPLLLCRVDEQRLEQKNE
jgi:hypothetical protein